jgi:hypothetical protein
VIPATEAYLPQMLLAVNFTTNSSGAFSGEDMHFGVAWYGRSLLGQSVAWIFGQLPMSLQRDHSK